MIDDDGDELMLGGLEETAFEEEAPEPKPSGGRDGKAQKALLLIVTHWQQFSWGFLLCTESNTFATFVLQSENLMDFHRRMDCARQIMDNCLL